MFVRDKSSSKSEGNFATQAIKLLCYVPAAQHLNFSIRETVHDRFRTKQEKALREEKQSEFN